MENIIDSFKKLFPNSFTWTGQEAPSLIKIRKYEEWNAISIRPKKASNSKLNTLLDKIDLTRIRYGFLFNFLQL